MPDEIQFASRQKVLDLKQESNYLKKLEATSESIQKAFALQEANAAVCFITFLS